MQHMGGSMKNLDKKWRVTIIAAAVVVLAVGVFFILKNNAYQGYLAGMGGYENLDVDTAVERYQAVVKYPKLFGAFIEDASAKLGETQTYQSADMLWADSEYAEAYEAFAAFIEDYPSSVFLEKGQTALAQIPFEWAEECMDGEDYDCAVEVYNLAVQNEKLPDESIEEAKELYFDVYTTWVEEESQTGDYQSCETLLLDLKLWTEANDSAKAKDVRALLTETYLDWGDLLYGEQDYETALAKYTLSLEQEVSRYAHRAEENIGAVYLDWGDELVQAGDLSGAGEKYGSIVLNYSETEAFEGISSQAYEPLILYAEGILIAEEFAAAEKILSYVEPLLEDGQEALKASARYGMGQAYLGQQENIKAATAFDQALKLTESESLKKDINTSMETALLGIGQLNNTLGESIIFAVANDIIGYKDIEPTCYTAEGVKTCFSEEELEIAYLAVGQDEDEKRIMLFIDGRGANNYTLPGEIEATRPGHFRYVGILKETQRQVESCKYSRTGSGAVSHHLVRMQKIYKVYLYDTQTGLIVEIGTFYGADPMACPRSYTFHGITEYVTGDEPEMSEVINWLRSYAE
jgi:tetratricopeptide (TPR) repeat protein